MKLADKIRALPSIKDEAGSECISREVVLAMLEQDRLDREELLKSLKRWRRNSNAIPLHLAKRVGWLRLSGTVLQK